MEKRLEERSERGEAVTQIYSLLDSKQADQIPPLPLPPVGTVQVFRLVQRATRTARRHPTDAVC